MTDTLADVAAANEEELDQQQLAQQLLAPILAGEFLTFHVPSHAVAFEVDQFDASTETGWSVLVLGSARLLAHASTPILDIPQTPRPWPEGQRPLVLQLPLTRVTGRRVHPA